jgi:hypothetical protein
VDARREHIQSLLERPRESSAVELKAWFDPQEQEGIARIVRTTFALRNQNGGFLVIGVHDTGLNHLPPPGFPVRERYHLDLIQQIVSRYASQSFEVTVDFEKFGEYEYPVISVPGGIVTPVACRADLKSDDGQSLLREGDIFVRTLAANGRISSARASWRDLDALVARCFENREADHVGFFRKLLPGITPEVIKAFGIPIGPSVQPEDTAAAQKKILSYGTKRFVEIANERQIDFKSLGFWDVALHINGRSPDYAANQSFLEILRVANPDLTGWPVWLDSSAFEEDANRPYTLDERWEAFVYSPRTEGFGHRGHLDFMIFDPKGFFFLRRALQDDLGGTRAETAGKTVDPVLAILRTGEAIAVGQAFARALKYEESADLSFLFRWTGLRGRVMTAWSDPMRWFNVPGEAKQNEVTSTVVIPQSATKEEIIGATHAAVLPLSHIFGGYELKEPVVRQLVVRLLDRKL